MASAVQGGWTECGKSVSVAVVRAAQDDSTLSFVHALWVGSLCRCEGGAPRRACVLQQGSNTLAVQLHELFLGCFNRSRTEQHEQPLGRLFSDTVDVVVPGEVRVDNIISSITFAVVTWRMTSPSSCTSGNFTSCRRKLIFMISHLLEFEISFNSRQ